MTTNPMQADARRAQRERRFGSDAACALCGLTTPESLIASKRSLLELHHVCGRANDETTVPLCRNCHAIATEGQRDADVSFAPPQTVLHRLAAILGALGAFFATLADRCADWAAVLTGFIEDLDDACPAWRDLPSARALGVSR